MAVKDLAVASEWYSRLLGSPGQAPGGWLQIYQLPERAGHGSFTLAVTDIEAETRKLESMGLDSSQRSSNSRVKTVMVTESRW